MPELNDTEHEVKATGPYTFEIGDCTSFGAAATQGYITQIKKVRAAGRSQIYFPQRGCWRPLFLTHHVGTPAAPSQPVKVTFRPLSEALAEPGEMMLSDFAKFDRPQVLHAAFRALAKYADEKGPIAPGDADAASLVVSYADDLFDGALDDAQKSVVTKLAVQSIACLSPMCAAIGGIVGQEVLKACSGKVSQGGGGEKRSESAGLEHAPVSACGLRRD